MAEKPNRIRKLEQNPNQRGHKSPRGKQAGSEDTATILLNTIVACPCDTGYRTPPLPSAALGSWKDVASIREICSWLKVKDECIQFTVPRWSYLGHRETDLCSPCGEIQALLPRLPYQGCPKAQEGSTLVSSAHIYLVPDVEHRVYWVISSCSDSTPVDSTPVLQFNYYNYLTSQVKGIVLSKTAVTSDSSCVSGVPRPPALLTDYKFRSSHDPLRFDHLTHRAQQNTIFAIVVVCLLKIHIYLF